jgi:hypothetical protein
MDTQAFFPANRQLPGDREGGHDGDRGPPLVGAPSSPLASPWWWATAMPPLWQYFLRLRTAGLPVDDEDRHRPKSESACGSGSKRLLQQAGCTIGRANDDSVRPLHEERICL